MFVEQPLALPGSAKDNLLTKEDSEEGLTEKDKSGVTKNHKDDMAPTSKEE